MNRQIVVALLLAPVACGLARALWILLWIGRAEHFEDGVVMGAFLPGLLSGVVFEVVALMPLLLLLRHIGRVSRSNLVIFGFALWTVAALLLYFWPFHDLLLRHSTMLLPLILLPGAVLVVVFSLLAYRAQQA